MRRHLLKDLPRPSITLYLRTGSVTRALDQIQPLAPSHRLTSHALGRFASKEVLRWSSHDCIRVVGSRRAAMIEVSIIARTLREGKTYGDFREV